MKNRYESEEELRNAVEKHYKRKIPETIWIECKPTDLHLPYDKYDLQEIIGNLQSRISLDSKRPRNPWGYFVLLKSDLIPQEILTQVNKCREELFGKTEPPFDSLVEMGKWIIAEAATQPPPEGHAPRFGYKYELTLPQEQLLIMFQERPGIYGIEYATLEYPLESGWTGNVILSDGTKLRRLWVTVTHIAKRLDCQEAQATGYILTGRKPLFSRISAKATPTITKEGISKGKIEIIIREPISDEDLIKVYRKMRKVLWGKERDPRPPSEKDCVLVKFVRNNLDAEKPKWGELMKDWNSQYPHWAFEFWQSFRMAYLRADDKIFPGVNLGPLNIK